MSRPRVLVIDAGLGNIGSVMAALQRQECDVERAQRPPSVANAAAFTHAVLPGVGAFAAGMEALRATGWDGWIQQQWCGAGRPLLGICLGMQLLASQGREGADTSGVISGLDLIPGQVQRLAAGPGFVLPHVGWNALRWHDPAGPLAKGLPDGGDMYFVHSYAFLPLDSAHCLAFSDYGQSFAAVVGKGSCYGVQFHPEKSQRLGRRLLENFLGLTPC